jgi:DinB superfamily
MSIFSNPSSRSLDQAREYTDAIVGLVGDRDTLDVLRATPAALRQAVAGLAEHQLSTPEAPGKWSIRQVVRHLADGEVVWGWRLRLVLAQDRPAITGYDQDAWAERLRYDEAPVDEALDEFAALRRTHLRLVGAATDADRARVGVHAERGEESVAHMMKMYAGHDLLHLRQIERIRGAIAPR